MKQKDLLIYGGAALAAWLIWQNKDALFGAAGTGKYTAGANPHSPWFDYSWGTLNLPGYSLFDGAMDSLGLTSTNTGYGVTGNGLGLKASGGLGMSYAGLRL